MHERVVVAMSGGVDSSVAALLLKEKGYRLIGLFMRNGVEAAAGGTEKKTCCSVYDARDARMVAAELDIPFHGVDYSPEFEGLIGYFAGEYARGRTPNPCAVCNRDLKFGRLFEMALSLGAGRIATGHYARVGCGADGVSLRRAADRGKDQSYQLFAVRRATLENVLLPLGDLRKEEVREIARRAGLPVAEKAESQEICFVPTNDYRDLLREKGVWGPRGEVVDRGGRVLACHDGITGFTIGQRRGVGVTTGEPRYVLEIVPEAGRITVGSREECLFRGLRATGCNWLGPADPGAEESLRLDAQIRYRHPGRPGTLRRTGPDEVEFLFDRPELAVTPGQAAVFYAGDRVVGGGWIAGSIR